MMMLILASLLFFSSYKPIVDARSSVCPLQLSLDRIHDGNKFNNDALVGLGRHCAYPRDQLVSFLDELLSSSTALEPVLRNGSTFSCEVHVNYVPRTITVVGVRHTRAVDSNLITFKRNNRAAFHHAQTARLYMQETVQFAGDISNDNYLFEHVMAARGDVVRISLDGDVKTRDQMDARIEEWDRTFEPLIENGRRRICDMDLGKLWTTAKKRVDFVGDHRLVYLIDSIGELANRIIGGINASDYEERFVELEDRRNMRWSNIIADRIQDDEAKDGIIIVTGAMHLFDSKTGLLKLIESEFDRRNVRHTSFVHKTNDDVVEKDRDEEMVKAASWLEGDLKEARQSVRTYLVRLKAALERIGDRKQTIDES